MPRVNHVRKARKPNPIVSQEDIDYVKEHPESNRSSYYWWKFRFGGKRYSKTRPRASQLTQSEFYGAIYGAQEDLADAIPCTVEDYKDAVQAYADAVEEQGQLCQEKLDNMPESLQYAPTGELLQERIDACESAYDEITSFMDDEPDVSEEDFDPDSEGFDSYEEYVEDWCRTKVEEVSQITPEA